MEIIWADNPLRTVVKLDEREKKELWYKLKVEELQEMIHSAYFALTHVEWSNKNIKPTTMEDAVKEAVSDLDPEYWCSDDKSKLDQRIDEMHAYYVADLQGWHIGDCTCVACSCTKCHAEGLLGIDTIKGLGKHSAHKVDGAFRVGEDRKLNCTIDEALEKLRHPKYEPPTDPERLKAWGGVGGYEKHIPRWKEENAHAITWLETYRDKLIELRAAPTGGRTTE